MLYFFNSNAILCWVRMLRSVELLGAGGVLSDVRGGLDDGNAYQRAAGLWQQRM